MLPHWSTYLPAKLPAYSSADRSCLIIYLRYSISHIFFYFQVSHLLSQLLQLQVRQKDSPDILSYALLFFVLLLLLLLLFVLLLLLILLLLLLLILLLLFIIFCYSNVIPPHILSSLHYL